MKKLVKSIAVVALLFVAATGLAKEPKLSLTPNSEKSLNFEIDKTSEKTMVSFVDANGQVIYKETIAKGKIFSKKFDLKNLPEGEYFIEVDDTLMATTFELELDDSVVKITKKTENAKPVFRQKEGRVFLNLLNLEKEVVSIKVVDSRGRIVFQETITDETLIEKVFNFKDAFEDDYTVIVEDKEDIYFEDVAVK